MSTPLRIGETAPDFERPSQDGRPFRLSSTRGRAAVIFFYPKDYTPACTAQACSFRDSFKAFADAGAVVIGVSNGAPKSHGAFAARHGLPFLLVADDGSIRKSWGVPRSLFIFPGRVTYVLDREGVVRHIYRSQMHVHGHVRTSLEVVERLSGIAAPGVRV
ncbi:MAG: peroxiredoxin [Phycisphaerales bacterium]